MEITEVRVALRETSSHAPGDARAGEKRLKAYATLTFDQCFVVRNIKIIEGKNGLFVAMPSRKPKVTCEKCGFKGDLGGRFCTQCGAAIPRSMERTSVTPEGEGMEAQAHRDIAHPITAEFRHYLQQKILDAYEAERTKSYSQSARRAEMNYEAV